MSDEPLKPPQEDNDGESAESNAFSDYVNDHLDLSDLEDTESFVGGRRAERPNGEHKGRGDDHDPWEVDDDLPLDAEDRGDVRRFGGIFGNFRPDLRSYLFDEDLDDDDDEDDTAGLDDAKPELGSFVPPDRPTPSANRPPARTPFGRSSYDPPLRTGGSMLSGFPFGNLFSRPPVDQSLPPRMPIPSADDSRWRLYSFKARPYLEIHHPAALTAPARVTLIPNAVTALQGRLYAIPAFAPGWTAVKVKLGMRQPIIGFVRADHITLKSPTSEPDWTTRLYKYAVSKQGSRALQAALLLTICVLLLILIALSMDFQPVTRGDLAVLETRLAEQNARIEALEAQLAAPSLR